MNSATLLAYKSAPLRWHVYRDGRRVGMVGIDTKGERPMITVKINKQCQRRGLGSFAIKQACLMARLDSVYATTRRGNLGAIGALKNAGFREIEGGRGQMEMVWTVEVSE